MVRSTAGAAGALALALLLVGGCSRDDETPAATSAAAAPGDPAVAASPGSIAGSGAPQQPAADPNAPAGQPADSDSSPLLPPSRPPGLAAPKDLSSLRVGSITATVTKGGSGPCYGLKTEDGVAWSVYSKKQLPLTKGDRVEARLKPGKTPVDCGAGKPATVVRVLIGSD